METVIAAFILITIALFAVLTIAHTYLSAQDALMSSWQQMETRTEERVRTDFSVVDAETKSSGSIVEITLRNDGAVKLADFDEWDVVVQYYAASGAYQIDWLPYTESANPGDDQWTVVGIYLDAATALPEVFEPGIFNPNEELVVRARLQPAVGLSTTNMARMVMPNGISASTIFTR